jgi:hypothetical protein
MRTLLRRPGFGGCPFAQAQVAFNENATKLILIGFVQRLLPASQAGRLVSAISLLPVAPFVFRSPHWLAGRPTCPPLRGVREPLGCKLP